MNTKDMTEAELRAELEKLHWENISYQTRMENDILRMAKKDVVIDALATRLL